jgi:hypothetical protein
MGTPLRLSENEAKVALERQLDRLPLDRQLAQEVHAGVANLNEAAATAQAVRLKSALDRIPLLLERLALGKGPGGQVPASLTSELFTPEAEKTVAREVSLFADQLVQSAIAIRESLQDDLVSAHAVAVAAESLYFKGRSRRRRVAGFVGGILAGAGFSGLLTVLQGVDLPNFYVPVSFILSAVGTFLLVMGFPGTHDRTTASSSPRSS